MLAREAKIPSTYKGLSQEGIDFINRMIQRHCKKRLGYNGIDEIMNHPWMRINQKEIQDFYELKM